MATQKVRFEYDPEKNILFVEDDYEIATPDDSDAFLALYRQQLQRIGRKVWVVASIDGLKVGPKVSDYYGKALKSLAAEHYLGLTRFGTDALSRMALRTSMAKAAYVADIYDSRAEAVAAIERMKQASPSA